MGLLIKLAGKSGAEIKPYLEMAVEKIMEGKLIAFPTDSVYGFGGDPLNLDLIERLYSMKNRERSKGFLLLISDIDEAKKIADFNETAEKLAKIYWPGELTLVLKKKDPNIIPPEVVAFQNTIGMRVPNDPIVLTILNILKERGRFGGIIGTSANFSGEPPATSGDEITKFFFGIIDYIIDNGPSKSGLPSTIVECKNEDLTFLRIGKISKEEIEKAISKN